ncbi:MAG: fatty acid desaturase [Polyangiaceae bacterium]
MTERSLATYVRELKPLLRRGIFKPARSRLWWLPAHLASVTLGMAVLSLHWVPWFAAPLLSLLIGVSFAGLTFLGHETLHGAVVRNRLLRHVVGWIGFAHFAVSPRLWIAWHNRIHHGNTQHSTNDPDAYPTLLAYRQSRALRVASRMAPGRGRILGVLSLLSGFSVQSAHMLVVAGKRGYLTTREHVYALLETLLAVALWTALAGLVGGLPFLFGFVLPLLVANVVVMSFILTNHLLSPLTALNDPLANSLTVTTPRWLEGLTLGFGFHVEHHLFPRMSARHAPEVRKLLIALWPERYQSMSLLRATAALHRSPRIYKTSTTLVDPHSGAEWATLSPYRS